MTDVDGRNDIHRADKEKSTKKQCSQLQVAWGGTLDGCAQLQQKDWSHVWEGTTTGCMYSTVSAC